MADTHQKLALVTGASRGLGAAIAEALSADHHVVAVGRTVGALEELDDRIKAAGGAATLAPMDITDAGAMATLCRGIHDRWGALDLWVHTAIHAAPLTPASMLDEKDVAKSFAVNTEATARLIPFVAPLLGTVGAALFVRDTRAGAKFFGSYGASKAAQLALAESWRAETVRTGPRVVIADCPPMPTALRARFFPGEDRAALTDIHAAAKQVLAQLNG